VAERLLRRPARRRCHGVVAAGCPGADAGRRDRRQGRGRRRRERWCPLARPDHAAGRAHETRRRPPASPKNDGGDGPAGLRPVRLQLRGLCRRFVRQEGGAAEPVRAGRQGNRPHAQGAVRGPWHRSRFAGGGDRCARSCPAVRRSRAVARQSGGSHVRLSHAAQQARFAEGNLARRIRSGRQRPGLRGRRLVRIVSAQRPGAGRRDHPGAQCAAGFPDRRPRAARRIDRWRVAFARPRHAVPTVFLHHRRGTAEEGQGAGRRRRPRRRCRDPRCAGGDREIRRRAARPRGLRRGARSAAAAALLDLVVTQGARQPCRAHRRCGALRGRQARAPRRRLDLPCRPRRAWRQAPGLCAEGAAFRPAGRSSAARPDRPPGSSSRRTRPSGRRRGATSP
jgi:hypothetical protein